MLLPFVIVLHVEWLFEVQRGPDKGNFWLILTHRSVMSTFGGRRNNLKLSKAPARAPEHQLVFFSFCPCLLNGYLLFYALNGYLKLNVALIQVIFG